LDIFASGFRQYLERELPSADSSGSAGPVEQLRDGTPLLRLDGDVAPLKRAQSQAGTISHVVVVNQAIELPGREVFLHEVLARQRFVGGPEAVYRALLTEGDAELGPRSRVLRWLHAEGDVVLRESVVLEGRGSSVGTMWLRHDVRFTRIRAKRVVVGQGQPSATTTLQPVVSSTMRLPRTARQLRGFIRVEGDLVVPAGACLAGTVVVYGDVELGEGARVAGSIKTHRSCTLKMRSTVDGSIVARGSIELGPDTRVGGPVVAERDVVLGARTVIGMDDSPTSVAAERITLHDGAQIFGAVSARIEAVVVP
jgi:predicted acyltransferase (DUF342 family)